jgi:hypothetical protein
MVLLEEKLYYDGFLKSAIHNSEQEISNLKYHIEKKFAQLNSLSDQAIALSERLEEYEKNEDDYDEEGILEEQLLKDEIDCEYEEIDQQREELYHRLDAENNKLSLYQRDLQEPNNFSFSYEYFLACEELKNAKDTKRASPLPKRKNPGFSFTDFTHKRLKNELSPSLEDNLSKSEPLPLLNSSCSNSSSSNITNSKIKLSFDENE